MTPGPVAIVLAAGHGSRFGGGKVSAMLDGRPLLDHAVAAALASPAERVIVVARPGTALAEDPRIALIELPSAALSDSLRAGLAAANGAEAALIFLGDMPLVPHGMAARLMTALGRSLAAVPEFDGKPGHPVLLARRGFALADVLTGDEGLGQALRGRADVVRVPVEEEGVVLDVDTREALAELERRTNP
ncbi:MAG: nucleotidyltransferase family protein [Novosphingobium sp.]